ncbi:MAG: helix-turn-helix transcriptional regulator [Veillonella sp.]|nr:helix-turn-helix transcriptional regulator [Veillonella sp.]
MHPSSTPLTELRINTYEDPFLQHQYVCLGHKIAIIRVSLNMSQQELARHIGISRSYLSKLECGTGISDYKNCNAHLTSHYKRLELLNHTKRTSRNQTKEN